MLRPSKGVIGIFAGVLALVVLVAGGILWWQHQTLTARQAVLAEKQKALSESKKIAARAEEASQALADDRAKLAFLHTGVPDAAYVPLSLIHI